LHEPFESGIIRVLGHASVAIPVKEMIPEQFRARSKVFVFGNDRGPRPGRLRTAAGGQLWFIQHIFEQRVTLTFFAIPSCSLGIAKRLHSGNET